MTDLQKIGDGWKDLEEIFKMGPIWHFQLDSFKSYKQNKVDCPKNEKFNDLYFMKVKNVNISKSALGNFLHSFAMDYTWVGPPETVIKVAVLLV